MTSMFRRRGGADSLPLSAPTNNGSFGGGGTRQHASPDLISKVQRIVTGNGAAVDGSARSIRLQKPLAQVWKESSTPTKVTYILCLFFLFMLYMGVRAIRHSNAHVHLHCRASDCTLSMLPRGIGMKKHVLDFPRRQLLQTLAVKTDPQGKFIEAHPPLYDHVKQGRRTQPSRTTAQHYKGPDDDGNFVSYAIVFRSKDADDFRYEGEVTATADGVSMDLVDFSTLPSEWLEDLGKGHYRLVMRLFDIPQSKRRISTMVHRIESYIKRRRQSLMVKENAVPSWQGVVAVVLGTVGVLLTILIGQFWEEDDPEVQARRRQEALAERRKAQKQRESLRRQTPAQFEVRTKAAPVAKQRKSVSRASGGATSLRNSTSSTSATTIRNSTATRRPTRTSATQRVHDR